MGTGIDQRPGRTSSVGGSPSPAQLRCWARPVTRMGSTWQPQAAGNQRALDVVGAAADHVHDRQAQPVLEGPTARHARDLTRQRGYRAKDLEGRLAEVFGELAADYLRHRRFTANA